MRAAREERKSWLFGGVLDTAPVFRASIRVWVLSILLFLWLQKQAALASSGAKEILAAHNAYRARAGTPPLSWSDQLASRAQQWANTLVQRNAFAPQRDVPLGQNLFEIGGAHERPANVVAAWMSEAANYNRETNTCTARCGHYTQVVWRTTKLVGCGVARNARREVWVCDYYPPGNLVAERPC